MNSWSLNKFLEMRSLDNESWKKVGISMRFKKARKRLEKVLELKLLEIQVELQICHTDLSILVFPNIYMTINTTYVYQVHRGLWARIFSELLSKGSSHK